MADRQEAQIRVGGFPLSRFPALGFSPDQREAAGAKALSPGGRRFDAGSGAA